MLKVVFALNRKDGMSHREFGEYWYFEHVDLIDQLPHLRRYTLAFPDDPASAAYDGIAELYFDDEEALAAAMDSPAAEEAAADVDNFADPDDIFQLVVEERTVVDKT